MKKIFLLISILSFVVMGCQTTSVVSSTSDDGFKTFDDEVRGVSFITHKDLERGYFYNLKDSLTGERENISIYISGKDLVAWADYQGSAWIFINGIVFLDSDGNRLVLDYGSTTDSDVNSGALNNVYIREDYGVKIKKSDIERLEAILNSSKVYVAFLGKKSTGKMELKSKYINAIKLTIGKWKSING